MSPASPDPFAVLCLTGQQTDGTWDLVEDKPCDSNQRRREAVQEDIRTGSRLGTKQSDDLIQIQTLRRWCCYSLSDIVQELQASN
jgi:hypothetical protein